MNPQNLFAGQQQEEARSSGNSYCREKAQEEEIRRQVEERLRAEAAQQQAAVAAAPVTTLQQTPDPQLGNVVSGKFCLECGSKKPNQNLQKDGMCMWQYCYRKILSGMRSTEAGRRKPRTGRMDLFLRNCQSGQILYELWSKKTGGCTVISL